MLAGEVQELGYRGAPGWSGSAVDTINGYFDARLALDRDAPFLDLVGEAYSYDRLDRESVSLAHGLRALGVGKGDTVFSMLDNGPLPTVLMFALFRLGAVYVGANTALKGEFLRHQASDTGARIIIAESDYVERILAIEDRLTDATHLFVHGGTAGIESAKLAIAPAETLFSGDETTPLDVAVLPSDLAMLVYTGGTTGPSKGCMISHNYACSLAKQIIDMAQLKPDDVVWTPLPNFHFNLIASTIVASLMVGNRAAIYTKFSLSNFWPEIERTGATRANLMGAMLPLIAQAEDNPAMLRMRERGQLKTMTGAPMPQDLAQTLADRFGVASYAGTAFGLTECSLLVSADADFPLPPNSVGARNPWFDVRIFDDDDTELPPGEAGEIVCRPRMPHIMFEGYWRRPADTLALWRNGWFHTGDVGKFDEAGCMYFVDRKKDYMRRRGENISSFEMDNCFRTHPAIEDVAVHAVKSDLSEDDVKVTAVLRPGFALTGEELCRWAIDNVPYYAVPRYYEFRDIIPRSVLGRVLKYELRDQGVTPSTFDMDKAGIKFTRK
jgi:crotonobetaine/carnitine-CoA ligase